MDKDSKVDSRLEDSGRGLLLAMEGHSQEWNRIECNF